MSLDEALGRYVLLVEEALARLLPKGADEEYLRWLTGIGEHSFDSWSIEETVLKPTWDLLERGGKRWRPVMMLLTYESLGRDPAEIADLSIIPELVHNGTLVVDDLEDKSDYRRGKPCIHRIYGEDVAINLGNVLYYLPLAIILRRMNLSQECERGVCRIYVEEMTNLSLGQALDIAWHRSMREDVKEEEYLLMCSLKTGSLARMAVRIACLMAGADSVAESKLTRFADAVAVAFQIQDDILNIVGEEEKYGKEIGGDIKEGKRTLMTIHALATLPRNEAERLKEILRMHTSAPSLISEAIQLLRKAGSVEYAKRRAREMVSSAWEGVRGVLRPGRAAETLRLLAEFLIRRDF